MSVDRELVTLAAKAAGIHIEYFNETNSGAWVPEDYDDNQHGPFVEWNPLTENGDALRLAVKLRLDVNVGEGNSCASIPPHDPSLNESPVEPHGNDPYAATRRAIVRAAAEIGAAK